MRRHSLVAAALLAAAPLALVAAPPTQAGSHTTEDASAALGWQAIAQDTVFVRGGTAPPVGALYLAFTSRAVHEAVKDSLDHPVSSEAAAVATAAHDVLAQYFPAQKDAFLDPALASTLAAVPDGPAERRGVQLGRAAAAELIADRADDGRGDASVAYTRTGGIGVWAPAPMPGGMAFAWLGSVDYVSIKSPVEVDGPDPVGSAAYRADREEVRVLGRSGSAGASNALFFNNPVPLTYHRALLGWLADHPLGLAETTRLFAQADAAMADAAIEGWRHKRDVGFWRPIEAIRQDDGDPTTTEDPTWSPVLTTPPYSDWPSGHAVLTSSFMGVVRCHLGDGVGLTLTGPGGAQRSYGSLSQLEAAALLSRIEGGLHFRDAMDDGYAIGHAVADRVARGC